MVGSLFQTYFISNSLSMCKYQIGIFLTGNKNAHNYYTQIYKTFENQWTRNFQYIFDVRWIRYIVCSEWSSFVPEKCLFDSNCHSFDVINTWNETTSFLLNAYNTNGLVVVLASNHLDFDSLSSFNQMECLYNFNEKYAHNELWFHLSDCI